MKLIDCKD